MMTREATGRHPVGSIIVGEPNRRQQLATESEYERTILDAAKQLGWRSAHFRPAKTTKGWRTAVSGDGKGFPDLLLVHALGGLVWFVELKRDDNPKLDDAQEAWALDLVRAGAKHWIVYVPSGLDTFLGHLSDVTRTKLNGL